MPASATRSVLRVFWDGEEVDGMTWYSYFGDPVYECPAFPYQHWPSDIEVKSSKLWGNEWTVWLYDMKANTWPGQWQSSVSSTLRDLVERGAKVSWCGLEGFFADPPSLFDPEMAPGVYAANSRVTGFICHTDLDLSYQHLTVSELQALKAQL